jgi:hypothetical protein
MYVSGNNDIQSMVSEYIKFCRSDSRQPKLSTESLED